VSAREDRENGGNYGNGKGFIVIFVRAMGVATSSRLLEMIGLFCKRAL